MSGKNMRGKRSQRSYRRKRSAVGKRKPSVSAGVKKYVKSQITRNIENKTIQVNGGQSFGNINESVDLNMYPMLPYTGYMSIPQGVTQGTRIGNTIRLKKLMLNYVLRPTPYDAVANVNPQPVEVELYLGYVNQLPGFLPVPGDLTFLYQNGASATGPVGNLRDLISVINTDYWTIKKRWRHKIGTANYGGTGANAAAQYYNNNDFKLNVVKKLDITKLAPKVLKFQDGAQTLQGRNLFFFYQAVGASGGTYTSTQLPCNIEFWIDVVYEDA